MYLDFRFGLLGRPSLLQRRRQRRHVDVGIVHRVVVAEKIGSRLDLLFHALSRRLSVVLQALKPVPFPGFGDGSYNKNGNNLNGNFDLNLSHPWPSCVFALKLNLGFVCTNNDILISI